MSQSVPANFTLADELQAAEARYTDANPNGLAQWQPPEWFGMRVLAQSASCHPRKRVWCATLIVLRLQFFPNLSFMYRFTTSREPNPTASAPAKHAAPKRIRKPLATMVSPILSWFSAIAKVKMINA